MDLRSKKWTACAVELHNKLSPPFPSVLTAISGAETKQILPSMTKSANLRIWAQAAHCNPRPYSLNADDEQPHYGTICNSLKQ
jgi:hypothetical protein